MIWAVVAAVVLAGGLVVVRRKPALEARGLNEGRLNNLARRVYDGEGELSRLPSDGTPLSVRLQGNARDVAVDLRISLPEGASSERMTAVLDTGEPLPDFPLEAHARADHPSWPAALSPLVREFLVDQTALEGWPQVYCVDGKLHMVAQLEDVHAYWIWRWLFRGASVAMLLQAAALGRAVPFALLGIAEDQRLDVDVRCVAAQLLGEADADVARKLLEGTHVRLQLAMARGLARKPWRFLVDVLRRGAMPAGSRIEALQLLRESDALEPEASIRERLLRELHALVKTASGEVLVAVIDTLLSVAETLPRKLLQRRFTSVGVEPRMAIIRAMSAYPRENVDWALDSLEREQGGTMLATALCGVVVSLGELRDVAQLESLAADRSPEFRALASELRGRVGGAETRGGLIIVDDEGVQDGALSLDHEGGELAVVP